VHTEALAQEIPDKEVIVSPRVRELQVLVEKLVPPDSSATPVPPVVAKQVVTVGQLTPLRGLGMPVSVVALQVELPPVISNALSPLTTTQVPLVPVPRHEMEGAVRDPVVVNPVPAVHELVPLLL
jgi:hypothetical protein